MWDERSGRTNPVKHAWDRLVAERLAVQVYQGAGNSWHEEQLSNFVEFDADRYLDFETFRIVSLIEKNNVACCSTLVFV